MPMNEERGVPEQAPLKTAQDLYDAQHVDAERQKGA